MTKNNDDLNDFGFTLEDSPDALVTETSESIKQKAAECLDKLHEAFLPLLNNLEKNPEKPTINWPDRAAKVGEFKKKLANLKVDLKNEIKKF